MGDDTSHVDVELVDADEGPPARPTADGAAPGGPTARHGARWAAVAVVAGLAVVGALAWSADRRAQDARQAALDAVPGLAPSLAEPLVERWRVEDAVPLATAGDVVVLDALPVPRLRGVRVGDGAEVWRRDLGDDAVCGAAAPPVPGALGQLVRSPALAADRVVCVDGSSVLRADGTVTGPGAVTVLDARTGAVLAELALEVPVLGAEVAGADLVVAFAAGTDVVVQRRPADLSAPSWSTTLPGLLPEVQEAGWVFRVLDGLVRVGAVGSPPLSLATGEPTPGAVREDVLYAVGADLPAGARVEWDLDLRARAVRVRLLGGDGVVRVDVPGAPWLAPVRDGSVPGVLPVRRATSVLDLGGAGSGELVGLDVATGDDRWSAGRLPGVQPLVHLDGLVVAAGAGSALGLDVATGRVVWRADGGYAAPPAGLTDGETVLVLEAAAPALVALDVRSGVERWSVPVPGPPQFVGVGGGAVLVLTDTWTTVALSPAG